VSDLPPGWAWTTLGEITSIVSGSTPKTGVAEYWGGDIAWITPDDRSRSRSKTITRGARTITQAGYESCSTTLMPPGAVLYSSRAPIGYAAIAAGPVCTNQGFKSFVPREVIVSDLLYWFLTYATPDIRKLGSGTTFPELSKAKAREIRIALPPLNEQRRIVAAIEEHLSRLDAADASLAAALRRLAPLRDHTFMAACPDGSPTVPLGELLREPLRNGHSAKASPNGTVRTLTLSAVTRGEFVEANTKLTAADPAKIERLWLEPGDVLIERSNTPELVGTAALFRGPRNWAIFPDLLIRVRVGDGLLPEFLEIVLKSRPTRRYFQAAAQGIAGSMPKIDQAVVERLEVSVPPLEEQRRIVQEVEERLSRIDAMRASIERAQRRSRALRAAILERAFRGELVPQDPSDEPAEALLARIRECQPKAETRVR
jgi:type I restriction enzyme S subunit